MYAIGTRCDVGNGDDDDFGNYYIYKRLKKTGKSRGYNMTKGLK